MKKTYLLAAALLAGLTAAAQAQHICRVTDPTGTKLNVRAAPGGMKLGTLKNGTRVEILEEQEDEKGQEWVLVGWSDQPLDKRLLRRIDREDRPNDGWVFREFISCYGK